MLHKIVKKSCQNLVVDRFFFVVLIQNVKWSLRTLKCVPGKMDLSKLGTKMDLEWVEEWLLNWSSWDLSLWLKMEAASLISSTQDPFLWCIDMASGVISHLLFQIDIVTLRQHSNQNFQNYIKKNQLNRRINKGIFELLCTPIMPLSGLIPAPPDA